MCITIKDHGITNRKKVTQNKLSSIFTRQYGDTVQRSRLLNKVIIGDSEGIESNAHDFFD
jgi:hypothetical protein